MRPCRKNARLQHDSDQVEGAGAIAARALLNPVAIGTGLGLIAAAGSAGAANGGLVFTALAEGVQVRLVASGVSSALRLANVNGLITIYTATDADGASSATTLTVRVFANRAPAPRCVCSVHIQ